MFSRSSGMPNVFEAASAPSRFGFCRVISLSELRDSMKAASFTMKLVLIGLDRILCSRSIFIAEALCD